MSIIDNVVNKLVAMVNKERKKKIEAINNVTDPKMRKIAKKYRAKIEKNTLSLLETQLKNRKK
jgi:methionyl-tRNA synthetase